MIEKATLDAEVSHMPSGKKNKTGLQVQKNQLSHTNLSLLLSFTRTAFI